MKILKRFLIIALSAAAALSCACAGYAEPLEMTADITVPKGGMLLPPDTEETWSFKAAAAPYASIDEDALYEAIKQGLLRHDITINISGFNVPRNLQSTYIKHLYLKVLYENADIMAFSVWDFDKANTVCTQEIIPVYMFSSYEADEAARQEMHCEINRYLAIADSVPDDDIVGKLLVIHDEFLKNNSYAYEELAAQAGKEIEELTYDDMVIYTAYGAFVNKRSVCQGISIALNNIYESFINAEDTGFCTYHLSGEAHIWNVLKVGDSWYHIDGTWNDLRIGVMSGETPIYFENIRHDYFLVSSKTMSDHYPTLWEFFADVDIYAGSMPDTRYESGYIFNGALTVGGKKGATYMEISYDAQTCEYNIYIPARSFYVDNEYQTYQSIGLDFRNASVRSSGALVSKKFRTSEGASVGLFMNCDIESFTPIFAMYQNGRLAVTAVQGEQSCPEGDLWMISLPDDLEGTMFFWDTSEMRAISGKASI